MMTTTTTDDKKRFGEEEEEEGEEERMHHDHQHQYQHHARHPSEIASVSAHSDAIKDETTFLSNQDEKIGHLERAIAFTEEDFVRPKFAHPTRTRGEQQQQQQQHGHNNNNHRHNASFTTCSILSLEDSALDVENGDAEAEALAARGRMYEQNTDLMGEEEEVDPRVETALEDMNDAAEKVNKAEREYERGKRTLREEKERAKETLDGMYKQLSGAVRKAVPALHKRAVASMYQNRSQEAMIAHAECFDHHQKCKRTVAKLERMLAKTRKEETKGKDGTSSLSSSFSHTDDDDEEEEEEEEEERNDALTEEKEEEEETEAEEETEEAEETRACGDTGEDPKRRAISPSASPTKNKKKKNRKKKRLDKSNLRLLEKLSEAVNNVAEAERVMRRALFAHETNAKLAMEAVAECTRLSGDAKNVRAIVKAQRYFAIKKEGEDAVEKLESSVKEMRANVKTSKARYGECLEQLNAISNEIHERRELEKKTKALKLMKSSSSK
tara:strand:- start:2720 stop:4213 length:1494 start_codon:yes stop_codon:yes gene_type:complete